MPTITFERIREIRETGQFDPNSRLFRAYWSHLVYWICNNYYGKDGYFELINNEIKHYPDE